MPERHRPRASIDVSRVLFYAVVSIMVICGTFVVGVQAGADKTAGYFLWTDLKTTIADSLKLTAEEAPTFTGIRPAHFLEQSRYAGDGVTVNAASVNQDDLVLLSGFFDGGNEVRLIRRNGETVARWPVKYHALFPNPEEFVTEAPQTDWNVNTHGAVVLPDGSVAFNFEYAGFAKLDRCSAVEWTLRRMTHHAVTRAEGGGFWVPGRRWTEGPSRYPPFETPFNEDTVMRVSENGDVLSEFSVVDLLYRSDLRAVLTATGGSFTVGMAWDREVVHLNQVDELTTELAPAFPMFAAGDLVLSIRGLNLILVTDPAGTTVKWWQIGPWLRQHDPHFAPDGRIILFNNNIFRTAVSGPDDHPPADAPLVSQVLAVDPAFGHADVLYGGRTGQEMLSVVRGKVSVTPGNGLLITEADGGRVREVNANREVVWEYVNRYSPAEVALLTQARVYPADYFDFDTRHDWPCDR